MNNKAKKITKIVISSISGIFLLIALYLLVCNIVAMKNEKPVRIFGFSYSYVPTSSMEPAIDAGDSIIFKKASFDSLEIGDIIVYRSNASAMKGMYIVHRIIDITSDGLTVKGDNNPIADSEVVTSSMLIGKYVRTFNFLNIGKLANNKNVIYVLLMLFFLGIIIMETVNITLARAKKKQKTLSPKQDALDLKKEILDEMREELLRELQEESNKEQK